MAKVTSKLQVSIPKRIADEYGIVPGDDLEFVVAAGSIRVVRATKRGSGPSTAARLALFDGATARQKARSRANARTEKPTSRGWTRDALYNRGRTR